MIDYLINKIVLKPGIMEINNIYIEEIGNYYHAGTLTDKEEILLEMINCVNDDIVLFEKNTIYNFRLFEAHCNRVQQVNYLDDITSCVSRCIEYGFKRQLLLLLSNLERLISMSVDTIINVIDKKLLLRKIDMECYTIAKEHRFIDPELEMRVTMMQRLIRNQSLNMQVYKGPIPEDYCTINGNLDYSGESQINRYFGYRQVLYFIKYNRCHRYQLIKLFMKYWKGDCRYQAYVDTFPADEQCILKL